MLPISVSVGLSVVQEALLQGPLAGLRSLGFGNVGREHVPYCHQSKARPSDDICVSPHTNIVRELFVVSESGSPENGSPTATGASRWRSRCEQSSERSRSTTVAHSVYHSEHRNVSTNWERRESILLKRVELCESHFPKESSLNPVDRVEHGRRSVVKGCRSGLDIAQHLRLVELD